MRDRCSEPVDEQCFSWGGVYPIGWPEGPSRRRADCLILGEDPTVEITVSFLQLIEHKVLDALGEPVGELVVDGVRHFDWLETAEREVRIPALPDRTASVSVGAAEDDDLLEDGVVVGRSVRRRETLHGTVEAWFEQVEPGLRRIQVSVANRLEWDGSPFEETLMHALCSTRVEMHSPGGVFASQADMPTPSLRQTSV
jgi:hypothetical protein